MWASGGSRDVSLREQRHPRCIPAAEATAMHPHRVEVAAMHPCGTWAVPAGAEDWGSCPSVPTFRCQGGIDRFPGSARRALAAMSVSGPDRRASASRRTYCFNLHGGKRGTTVATKRSVASNSSFPFWRGGGWTPKATAMHPHVSGGIRNASLRSICIE